MTNVDSSENITIGNHEVKVEDKYTYLSRDIRISRDSPTCELKRRIILSWVADGKLTLPKMKDF